MSSKAILSDLLKSADIDLNGSRPHDVRVNDERLFRRMLTTGSLGAGEGYMDGWWDCEQLDEFFHRICSKDLEAAFQKKWMVACKTALGFFVNLQTRVRSLRVAEEHYNLGNDLYEKMLGPTMAYTCAYWDKAKTLDEAQAAKFDLVCRKLGLKKGERVLELGCGWGTLAKYAAENYGVEVAAVNISTEQIKYARENVGDLPVTYHLCDFRDDHVYNPGKRPFDKVMSVGLCEHVGRKNYRAFMETAHRNLNESGLFLLHTIGRNDTSYFTDPWINKYIFPNGMLPSLKSLTGAAEKLFVVEDLHNIGADYDKTLMAWHNNFTENWGELKEVYGDRFYRLWNYYLLSCAGAFRARSIQLWQVVLAPKGVPGGYRTVR